MGITWISVSSAERWRARRFRTLLVAQATLLLTYPYLEEGPIGMGFLVLLNALVMVSAVYAAAPSRTALALGVGLAALASTTDLLVVSGWSGLAWWAGAGDVLFFGFTAAVLFLEVFRSRAVDQDVLAGAACCFILIAFAWSSAYVWLETAQPGSFSLPAGADPWSALLYFSFVTLTTLGYGEIIPIVDAARSLVLLEAVVGVLYSAIVVARLVGLAGISPAPATR